MAQQLLGKNLGTPDELTSFEHGEVRKVNLDGFRVALRILQPGWRWSEHVKSRSGTESCQVLYRGYVVSGRSRGTPGKILPSPSTVSRGCAKV